MRRIQQLSNSVVNKIAAGEVIERPASVVKELVENSIDAGATRVEVDIAAGGSELIRVTDDGGGIHADDILLAVTTHATSKIRTAEDLFQVSTLGFRGEALASIAEVSHLRIRSRQPESETGSELVVNLGERSEVVPCGCAMGTCIEIRQLFGNTPVRRKFLKSASTEFGHIAEQFTRIALARSNVHMVLRHNDRIVYELPATDRLLDRLEMFYGSAVSEQMISIENTVGTMRLWGYAGHPALNKATRKLQHLFLNGRWFQDRSIQHALTEAYRGLIMVQRHPVCFLFLEIDPADVDVNVHPTKVEVRFQDSQQVYRLLLSSLRNRFLGMDLESKLRVPAAATIADPVEQNELQNEFSQWAKAELLRNAASTGSALQLSASPHASTTGTADHTDILGRGPFETDSRGLMTEAEDDLSENRFEAANLSWSAPTDFTNGRGVSPFIHPPGDDPTAIDPSSPPNAQESDQWATSGDSFSSTEDDSRTPMEIAAHTGTSASLADPASHPAERRSPAASNFGVRALQIHDCYLVVETDEGMTVIDQHALHERILYEEFRKRVHSHVMESQRLLIPIPIQLGFRGSSLLLECAEHLQRLGFDISEFGQGTILLSAYPAMLGKLPQEQLLRDLAEQLESSSLESAHRDILDELLNMMACKAAVKSGQKLAQEEIEALLTQRHLVDDAHHCPHGRPTALNLSRSELDRQFGRLGS
jgi:DNA mismatch repair protein MutL